MRSRLGSWHVHLEAAIRLTSIASAALRRRQQQKRESLQAQIPTPLTPESCSESYAAFGDLSPQMRPALSFMVTTFTWFIALSPNASTSQFGLTQQSEVLQSPAANKHIEMVCGCHSWVYFDLIDATLLQRWAQEARANRTFTVRELAHRAQDLEERLETSIAQTLHPANTLEERLRCSSLATESQHYQLIVDGGHTSETLESRQILCISVIFAIATLTYIHLIVEGFNPNSPEIRSNVLRILAALAALPEEDKPAVLPRLIWPITITGLVAGDDHAAQLSVKKFLIAATKQPGGVAGAPSASASTLLQVIEDTWERHETAEQTIALDLATVANVLGLPVLLI